MAPWMAVFSKICQPPVFVYSIQWQLQMQKQKQANKTNSIVSRLIHHPWQGGVSRIMLNLTPWSKPTGALLSANFLPKLEIPIWLSKPFANEATPGLYIASPYWPTFLLANICYSGLQIIKMPTLVGDLG
jgi:hypothetical protein